MGGEGRRKAKSTVADLSAVSIEEDGCVQVPGTTLPSDVARWQVLGLSGNPSLEYDERRGELCEID